MHVVKDSEVRSRRADAVPNSVLDRRERQNVHPDNENREAEVGERWYGSAKADPTQPTPARGREPDDDGEQQQRPARHR